MEEYEKTTEIEFMRKSRFESIRSKFSDVSEEAKKIIESAGSSDILSLTLTFNSPIKVLKAEVFDEEKFLDLAF